MTEEQREQLNEIRQSFLSGNYKIICDETNNTSQDIESGVVNVTIIPYRSLDYINVDFCNDELQ